MCRLSEGPEISTCYLVNEPQSLCHWFSHKYIAYSSLLFHSLLPFMHLVLEVEKKHISLCNLGDAFRMEGKINESL